MLYEKEPWFFESTTQNYPNYKVDSVDKCTNKMSINGRGSVKANPDIVEINMGVITEDIDLMAAQRENSAIMEKVIEALKRLGVEDNDLETSSYVIEPMYEFAEGKQIFKGYRVRNILKTTVRDKDKAGQIIDMAVKNGANTVRDIEFTLSDPSKYYDQALRLAVQDAVRKAEVVADTIGTSLNKIPKEIVEESFGVVLGVQSASMDVKALVTPIRPGPVEVTANVKAVFCY